MSLISGWLPATVQLLTLVVLVIAIGWRSRRWRLLWVPAALLVGVVLATAGYRVVRYQSWGHDAALLSTWVWVALTGMAAAILVLGWRDNTWWRRALSMLAIPLCVVSAAVALNVSLGYLPTVQSAWDRLTGSQPPQWIDQATLAAMQRDGVRPTGGTLVWMDTPAEVSGFAHRREVVYLPPAWFASNPPPALPGVMMIGAEFSSPSDWLQSAHALKTLDEFAALHRGDTPVMVFPDSTGRFNNDTECVNGPRGHAADHLTKEVVPYVISHFGVRSGPANWGLVGWSSGGTCALTLAVTHPELFSAFVDLDGQLGPNAGTKQQTIARLFGGDADAWAAFDPKTAVLNHGPYTNMSAWVGVADPTPTVYRAAGNTDPPPDALANWDPYSEHRVENANKLCQLLSSRNIECAVVSYSGSHDFPSAGSGFAAALPWLAGRLGTPDVPKRPMPGAPSR